MGRETLIFRWEMSGIRQLSSEEKAEDTGQLENELTLEQVNTAGIVSRIISKKRISIRNGNPLCFPDPSSCLFECWCCRWMLMMMMMVMMGGRKIIVNLTCRSQCRVQKTRRQMMEFANYAPLILTPVTFPPQIILFWTHANFPLNLLRPRFPHCSGENQHTHLNETDDFNYN